MIQIGSNTRRLILVLLLIIVCAEYHRIGLIYVRYGTGFIDRSPFDFGAGEEQSLPKEAISLKNLVEKHNLKYFGLSARFNEQELMQRAIEFAYPARYDERSPFKFALVIDPVASNCRLIDVQNEVALYECRP